MSDINKMDIETLQHNVIRRNVVMNTLKKFRGELMNTKKSELDRIEFDDDHLAMDAFIRRKFSGIIDDIDNLLKSMNNGDWSLSVESTKEREKQFPCNECGKVGCTKHK